MKFIISTLTILTMINLGYTGDKELEKTNRGVHQPRSILSIVNQTILDVYHATDPLTKGHQCRMGSKINDTDARCLRRNALHWIGRMCEEWPQLTGLKREETNEILDRIYSETRTDGPDQESRIRDKLLEVRPDLRSIHPEYIRSVIHEWYRSRRKAMDAVRQIRSREDQADLLYTYCRVHSGEGYLYDRLAEMWKKFHPDLSYLGKISLLRKANELSNANPPFSTEEMKEAEMRYKSVLGNEPVRAVQVTQIRRFDTGKIRSREEEADLLYTYYQVQNGDGTVHDRLAEKWKEFHPRSSNYSKITLFRKANGFSNSKPGFGVEEMEAAKMRYEKMFRSENAARRERVSWTKEQTADLLYLRNSSNKKELNSEKFLGFWQALHPEFASLKKRALLSKLQAMKKRCITLTPEEEAAAGARFKAALARNKRSHQNILITDKAAGKSPATQSSPGQELHQQSSDWMIHSPPYHDDLQLSQEERNDLEMWLNEGTLHHCPTPRYYYEGYTPPAPSRFPGETSHSHLSRSPLDTYTANPYYEPGSSSHSHYNTDTTNQHYRHGGSNHSHYNPHP